MKNDLSKGNDLFDAIKRGHLWPADSIKIEIDKLIAKHYSIYGVIHDVRIDDDGKTYFLYDNECYLFIFDKEIEVQCLRKDVFVSNETVEYPIKNVSDIEAAFDYFIKMAMESEEDDQS